MREVLCYLSVTFRQRFFWRRELYCSDAATSPRDLVALLLRPSVGFVEVLADPVELVSETMKGALVLRVESLEQVLLVENCLEVLDGGAYFLVENPDNFFCRLLLEVGEGAAWRC